MTVQKEASMIYLCGTVIVCVNVSELSTYIIMAFFKPLTAMLKTLPPVDFCTVIVHEIILLKSTIPTGSISEKKLVYQEGISRLIL